VTVRCVGFLFGCACGRPRRRAIAARITLGRPSNRKFAGLPSRAGKGFGTGYGKPLGGISDPRSPPSTLGPRKVTSEPGRTLRESSGMTQAGDFWRPPPAAQASGGGCFFKKIPRGEGPGRRAGFGELVDAGIVPFPLAGRTAGPAVKLIALIVDATRSGFWGPFHRNTSTTE